MSKLAFLAAFGVGQANSVLDTFIQGLVRLDPKTASEADITLMTDEVTKVARLKVDAATELKELKEHIAQLTDGKTRALAALTILKGQADTAPNDGAKNEIIGKAQLVNHQIEILEGELTHDKESVAAAEEWLTSVTKALDDAAQKLASARQSLADAAREMKRASQEKQLAEQTLNRQKQLAGITGASNTLGVALSTMQKSAAETRQTAAANLEAAKALHKASTSGSDVVNEVLGQTPQAQTSDPFARLNNQAA